MTPIPEGVTAGRRPTRRPGLMVARAICSYCRRASSSFTAPIIAHRQLSFTHHARGRHYRHLKRHYPESPQKALWVLSPTFLLTSPPHPSPLAISISFLSPHMRASICRGITGSAARLLQSITANFYLSPHLQNLFSRYIRPMHDYWARQSGHHNSIKSRAYRATRTLSMSLRAHKGAPMTAPGSPIFAHLQCGAIGWFLYNATW